MFFLVSESKSSTFLLSSFVSIRKRYVCPTRTQCSLILTLSLVLLGSLPSPPIHLLHPPQHIDFALTSPYGGARAGRVKRKRANAAAAGTGEAEAEDDEE